MRKLAYKLLAQNRKDIVDRLIKIHAFDARFPLKQENCQWLYMLDPPIYDFAFEIHYKDGNKKLMTDQEALELLNNEMKFSETALQETEDHLKNLDRFHKFGPLKKRLAPLQPKPEPTTVDVVPEAAEASLKQPILVETTFDVEPGLATLEAATIKATRNEYGFSAVAHIKNTDLFTAHFNRDGKLKWLTDVKCTTNAKFFEKNYQKLFQE